jgi:hypothetical protein
LVSILGATQIGREGRICNHWNKAKNSDPLATEWVFYFAARNFCAALASFVAAEKIAPENLDNEKIRSAKMFFAAKKGGKGDSHDHLDEIARHAPRDR